MTPTGQMSKSLVNLPTALQVSTSATPEHREACYQQSMISCSHAHRLAIATIHHCSPPTCIAPIKQAPISMQVPTAHVTHEINFTFISTYLCLPAYLSTYANLTAPVPAEGAIHETVIELLSVALLWVIAICRWWSLVHDATTSIATYDASFGERKKNPQGSSWELNLGLSDY